MACCVLHSHKCINNGLYGSWQCTYCTGRALCWLKICTESGVLSPASSIKPRDKAKLKPLGFVTPQLPSVLPHLGRRVCSLSLLICSDCWKCSSAISCWRWDQSCRRLDRLKETNTKSNFDLAMNNKPLLKLASMNFCAIQTFQMRTLTLSAEGKLDGRGVPRMPEFLSWYFWTCLWWYLWEHSDLWPKPRKEYA